MTRSRQCDRLLSDRKTVSTAALLLCAGEFLFISISVVVWWSAIKNIPYFTMVLTAAAFAS
jgi:hypothetical protein